MKIKLNSINKEATVAVAKGDVINLLGDIPQLLSFFPRMEEIEQIGDRSWHLHFRPLKAAGMTFPLDFGIQVDTDSEALKATLSPVPGLGMASIGGHILIQELEAELCRFEIELSGQLDMSVPLPIRAVAPKFAKQSFSQMMDIYLQRLQARYGDPS